MSQQNTNEVANAAAQVQMPETNADAVEVAGRRSERKRKRPVTFWEEFRDDINKVLEEGDKEQVDGEDLDDGQPRLDPEAPMTSVYAMQIYESIKRVNAGTGISDAELWDMASEVAMFQEEVEEEGEDEDEYESSFINDDSEEDYDEDEEDDEYENEEDILSSDDRENEENGAWED